MNIIIFVIGFLTIGAGVAVFLQRRAVVRRKMSWGELSHPPTTNKTGACLLVISIVCGLALMLFSISFHIVPSGYTGVRTTFGLIDQTSCLPGFNWMMPFVQNISHVNNKQQDIQFIDQISGETSERITVIMSNVQVTYQILPEASAWIYANVSNRADNLIDLNMTSTSLKSAARELSVDNVTNRPKIQNRTTELLQGVVDAKYGADKVLVKNVIVGDMDFLPEYNEAIESKARALQVQEQQAIENKTAVDKATADGEAAKKRAEAEAEAELIRAQAKADANKIIRDSVTDVTQRQDIISKWDGALPRYVGGSDAVGILDSFIREE